MFPSLPPWGSTQQVPSKRRQYIPLWLAALTRGLYGEQYEEVSRSFGTDSLTTYMFTFGITRWQARVMAAKLTRLTHKIAIQLHLMAESSKICSSRSRRPVPKIWIQPRMCLFSIPGYKQIIAKQGMLHLSLSPHRRSATQPHPVVLFFQVVGLLTTLI
jgi:hypothetical protein